MVLQLSHGLQPSHGSQYYSHQCHWACSGPEMVVEKMVPEALAQRTQCALAEGYRRALAGPNRPAPQPSMCKSLVDPSGQVRINTQVLSSRPRSFFQKMVHPTACLLPLTPSHTPYTSSWSLCWSPQC
jgi:hypothetical protein